MACQRMTDAICHVHRMSGHTSLAYIDDFSGLAATPQAALEGYQRLGNILQELGIEEAREKSIPPCSTITWIGIEFDSRQMMVRMPREKIQETLYTCIKTLVSWMSDFQK